MTSQYTHGAAVGSDEVLIAETLAVAMDTSVTLAVRRAVAGEAALAVPVGWEDISSVV